jgi:hypothetical protein
VTWTRLHRRLVAMSTTTSTPPAAARPLSPAEERRVAVRAGCDPRTVRRYLDGGPTTSTASDRIRRALDALGYVHARRMVRV